MAPVATIPTKKKTDKSSDILGSRPETDGRQTDGPRESGTGRVEGPRAEPDSA